MTMKLKTLSLYTALVGTLFSSAALADIDLHGATGTTTNSTINLTLTIEGSCTISGLNTSETKTIDASTGKLIFTGVKATCNTGRQAQISFESSNGKKPSSSTAGDYQLLLSGAAATKTLPYTVTLGNQSLDAGQKYDMPVTDESLTIKVTSSDLKNEPAGDYTDILTATMTL